MTDRPIISIPIDSSAFEKFVKLLNQYDEKLSEQPAAWKKLNDVIAKTTPSAGKISAHFSDTSDSSDSVAKSLSASTRAMEALLSATQKSNAAMNLLVKSTSSVGKGVFDAGAGLSGLKTTLSLLGAVPGIGGVVKIAEIATAVAAAGGALALKNAHSVSNTARAAFGANASYGQFQNTNAQLSPFLPNPGGSLQNIAAAQWNPAAAGALGLFGVTSRMSSQQALATVLRSSVGTLRATHNLALPQVTYAEQLAGLSPTDMISLANQNPKDLNSAITNMLNPSASAAQTVNGSVISSDQRLTASWAASMNTASAKFAAALAPLNPAVDKFGQFVAKFAGSIDNEVQATNKLFSELGLVKNNLPIALGGQGNGPDGIQGGLIRNNLPPILGGQGNGPGGVASVPSDGTGMKNLQNYTSASHVMKAFMMGGLSRKAAAAMTAQASAESSFNAGVVSHYKGKTYAGLFQYDPDRRAKVLAETAAAGLNGGAGYDMWSGTPDQQVAGSIWDLNHDFKSAAAKINAAKTYAAAGVAADNYYEVSGDGLVKQAYRGGLSSFYGHTKPAGQAAPQNSLPPDVTALLTKLGKQQTIKVTAHVSNSTSARVAMSAQAAVN